MSDSDIDDETELCVSLDRPHYLKFIKTIRYITNEHNESQTVDLITQDNKLY